MLQELSKGEIREILRRLRREYEIDENFLKKIEKTYSFFRGRKKIFIGYKDEFPAERRGIYILSEEKYGLRFSVEGSQIFGPYAKKKIIELNEKEFLDFLRGKDIERKTEYKREFVIVRHKNHYLGSALAYPNKLVNYLSKARRII